jgi:CubicO group peptidase (beta-lactamase class C family)
MPWADFDPPAGVSSYYWGARNLPFSMRRLVLLTAAILVSATVLVPAATDDLVLSRFSDYLDALRGQAGIPGLSATIVRDGDGTWEQAYGRIDLERAIATRTDTPFEIDGITQLFTASLIMQCAEEGRLSLDDPIGKLAKDSPEPGATLRQILTHTSLTADGLVFSYRPSRLNSLVETVAACRGMSFRAAVAQLLDRFAMLDSIPGLNSMDLIPPADHATTEDIDRYTALFDRLARPYSIDSQRRATPSQYVATGLTPASGMVTTVRDLARFDTALRRGVVVDPSSLADAWTPPLDSKAQRLPHGIGWFVQNYNAERIVWQFGVSDNASSSLIITVPSRGVTMILFANSSGLAKPTQFAAGDVLVSPFARLFLSIFVR